MKRILLFALLVVMFGCAVDRSQTEIDCPTIVFTGEFDPISRATATAFEAGDQLGVYLVNENQQFSAADNRVNNVCFKVGADGRIKSDPVLYYPDNKTAVTFHAYYPYQATVENATKLAFAVEADQTTAENVKKSDFCYAHQSVTPSEDAQALQFSHLLSKVVLNIAMSSNVQSVDSVKFVDAAVDLKLDLSNGAITEGVTRAPISTKNEAIIPPQTFAANAKMVAVDVKLVDGTAETYYFTPLTALTFEPSKVTTINLTLNDNKTITLDGTPQIVAWTKGTAESEIKRSVNNKINIHRLPAHPRAAEVNRIVLTIKNETTSIVKDYEIEKPAYANSVFSFDFAADDLTYPYTVTKIALYKGNETIENSLYVLLSNSIYKAGEHNLGAGSNRVLINGLYWATGSLVADGANGAKIGTDTDYGLYFQFGSLVGWSTTDPLAIVVRPTGYTATPSWKACPRYTGGAGINDIVPIPGTPSTGIGDACRTYLGGTWRLPTAQEYKALFNNAANDATWATAGGSWQASPPAGKLYNGLSFPAAGYRGYSSGLLGGVRSTGRYWSASVYNDLLSCYFLNFTSSTVAPQINAIRDYGFPVRCVSTP